MKDKFIFILILFLLAAMLLIYVGPSSSDSPLPGSTTAKEKAIQEAKDYEPEGVCTTALVPAVHKETGAKYTFPSGCLAPGWEPEQ